MKTTGITRRIDELGRIVIPKEIRKNLHIKSGELLEIFLSDDDCLVFKKYNTINKKNSVLKEVLKVATKKGDFNMFICDFNRVIFSNKKELEDKYLDEKLDIKQNSNAFNFFRADVLSNRKEI